MVEAEPIPARVERAIRAAYAQLSAGETRRRVAVRSSATAEDTEAASFAGMNETFLNVRGADAVVDAVRRCWSSLFGARTVFYRAKRASARPTWTSPWSSSARSWRPGPGSCSRSTRLRGHDRLVIEGSFGLGEAVVSGSVSPDRYVVEKDTLAIIAREVTCKELVIEPVARRRHGDSRASRRRGEAAGARPTTRSARWRSSAGGSSALRRRPGHRMVPSMPTARVDAAVAAGDLRRRRAPPRASSTR